MNKTVVEAAGLLLLAMSHAATVAALPPPPGAVTCSDTSLCKISISVSACSDAGITVTPAIIYIPPGNKPVMRWEIQSHGYTFVDNGISWKDSDGDSEFDGQNPQPWATTYEARNLHTKSKGHDYAIDLQNSAGKKCHKDPTVFNG